jgi:hypothetical protein
MQGATMADQPTLEQMRAFLISQGKFPQDERYDDGTSLLGQNSDMQQVGFKIPKVPKVFDIPHDPGRRTMGLSLPKQSNLPVGPQTPFAQALAKERGTDIAPVAQETPAQAPNISPLEYAAEAIKNMPMTRRQVLQTPFNAAVSHYGRKLLGPMDSAAEPTAALAPEAEMVLPTFSEEEIAGKTGQYITGLMADPDFRKAYIDTVLPEEERGDAMFEDYPDEAYNSMAQLGGTHPHQIEAFKSHLSLEKMSEDTGIPLSELQKYTSETGLHDLLNRMGDNHSWLTGILEDGRPKEAWRSTALGDLNYKKIMKSAVKELGKDADYGDLINLAEEKAREEYMHRMQRGMPTDKQLKAPLDFNERAAIAGAQNYTQQLIDDVYDQGSEYVMEELESRLDELLGD